MRPRIELIADIDPSGVFRVVGTAKNLEEAEAFIVSYRVEHGPLVDVRILNNTGRELKRKRHNVTEKSSKKDVYGSTQIKGGR